MSDAAPIKLSELSRVRGTIDEIARHLEALQHDAEPSDSTTS